MAARLCKWVETYSLQDGGERAQTSLWFLSPAGQTMEDLRDVLIPLRDDRWSLQKALHSTHTGYLGSRLYTINITNGHVISSTDTSAPASTAGTDAGGSMPAECAEVLTLRTLFDTRRSRGRIFLPPFGLDGVDSLGRITLSKLEDAVDMFATFFNGVNSSATDWTPGVYSRLDEAFSPLSAVDMGNVYDVQRSRRRSLVEFRYAVTLS